MAQYFRWNNKKKGSKKKNTKHKIAECSVPSFRIDLQCPPAQRWTHIVKIYHKEIKRLIQAILSLEQYQISSDDDQNNNDNNSNNNDGANKTNFFTNLTLGVFERLKKLGGKQYIEEMKGIAKLFKKDGLSIEHILLTHLLYESFCGCTSIISKTNDGDKTSLVLGRTLDWIDFDEQLLRNLTIDIQVYNGNKYLYRYTTFAGYIGALTALKFNQFGFSINFREFSSNEANDDVHVQDSWPIGLLARFICEQCNDYKSATKMWNDAPLMAPTYIIITGLNQSQLITRDEGVSIKPLSTELINNNDEEKKNDNINNDYLLQTNIDHWSYNYEDINNKKSRKKKKKIDHDTMDSIRRLNTGHKYLKEMKGNLNEEEMWKLLYQFPIHDKNWTIYTTVMNVTSGYYKTIRHIYK